MNYTFGSERVEFFQPTHKYFVGSEEVISTTSLLKLYDAPFPKYKIAQAVADKEGVELDVILNRWNNISQTACKGGSLVHETLEHFINTGEILEGYELLIDNLTRNEEFVLFSKTLTEQRFHFPEYKICGTFDLATFDNSGNFLIYDFKTGQPISNKPKYNKKLRSPISNLYATNYNKYSLQLEVYKTVIESYGFNCLGAFLIHIDTDFNVTFHEQLDVTSECIKMLNDWRDTYNFDVYNSLNKFSINNN